MTEHDLHACKVAFDVAAGVGGVGADAEALAAVVAAGRALLAEVRRLQKELEWSNDERDRLREGKP